MRICLKNNINFNIDSRGRIVRTVVWEVMPDIGGIENWDTFSDDIEIWANSTNGQLRDAAEVPTASHINADYLIIDYSVNYTGQWIAEVTFNAVRKETEALMISGVDETISENGEKSYSATFKIHADNIDGWLPEQNDVIAWAGAACMCLSINKKEVDSGHGDIGQYEVQITARDMSTVMLGLVTHHENEKLEKTATGKWQVSVDAYESFRTNNAVNSDAAWAGDGYKVTSFSSDNIGKIGYEVTLEAKHIGVRLIEVSRRENFVRNDSKGEPIREIVYTGRWQVAADSKEEFEEIAGLSAEDWTGQENFIAQSVSQVQISENEWEYTIESKDINSSVDSSSSASLQIDRSNLGSVNLYNIRLETFRLSAEMCGWTQKDGKWVTKNFLKAGDWIPSKECPFTVSSELEKKSINTTPKCAVLEHTKYVKGTVKDRMSALISWLKSNKIISGSVNGYGNSWRVLDQSTEQEYDNNGDPWIKLTRVYMDTPGSQTWNATYFEINED